MQVSVGWFERWFASNREKKYGKAGNQGGRLAGWKDGEGG